MGLAPVGGLGYDGPMLNTILHGAPTDVPPLLIAHGLFGSGRNWGVIAKRLSDRGQVIAVDMRNHGASPWSDTHGYDDLAADLAEVIAAHGGVADVLGHSMGGKAAMMLALTHPDSVRKLIVADIAPVAYTHTQMHVLEALKKVELAQVTRRSEAAAQLAGMGLDPGLQNFLTQSLDVAGKRWRLNLGTLEREMPKILSFPETDAVFEGRTLFLSGAASDYVRPEHRDRIKALFPRAVFSKIPGAGHWLHAEKPREFEAAVRVFLDA